MLRIIGNGFLMLAAMMLMLWSVWHLFFGKNGYMVMQNFEEKIAISEQQITFLQQEYDNLYHKINLMKGDNPDLDLLEEQIRKVLFYGRKDELILTPTEEEFTIITSP